jgi:hypothetical protein
MAGDEVDSGLQTLLDMDGETGEVGGGYWYKIEARTIEPTAGRPNGVKYSLTLHTLYGTRVYGIDNAHEPKITKGLGRVTRDEYDHEHKNRKVEFYGYTDAMELLKDFFENVEIILEKSGVGK